MWKSTLNQITLWMYFPRCPRQGLSIYSFLHARPCLSVCSLVCLFVCPSMLTRWRHGQLPGRRVTSSSRWYIYRSCSVTSHCLKGNNSVPAGCMVTHWPLSCLCMAYQHTGGVISGKMAATRRPWGKGKPRHWNRHVARQWDRDNDLKQSSKNSGFDLDVVWVAFYVRESSFCVFFFYIQTC